MIKDIFEVVKVEVGRMYVYYFFYELDKNYWVDVVGSVIEGLMYDLLGLRNYFMVDLC